MEVVGDSRWGRKADAWGQALAKGYMGDRLVGTLRDSDGLCGLPLQTCQLPRPVTPI